MRPEFSTAGVLVSLLISMSIAQRGTLQGRVMDADGQGLARARVTVFASDISYFGEARTDSGGYYRIPDLPNYSWMAGASLPGKAYLELALTTSGIGSIQNFTLSEESNPGRWDVVLSNAPDRLGGTNSAALLPDGRVLYCHNTIDPFVFNPVGGGVTRPPASPRQQGCHAVTLLPGGLLIYVGGHETGVYGPGTRQVKTYDPVLNK